MPAIRGSFLLVAISLSSVALGQSALPTLGEAALPVPYNGAEIPLQNPAPQAQEPASPSRSKLICHTIWYKGHCASNTRIGIDFAWPTNHRHA
jgi:hypothetical protein